MNFLFSLAPYAMFVVCIVALCTALLAATIALTQNDIKKVLAYSTVSQLGFMFIGVSAGAYDAAVFHLVTHAFFKACLFLGAGSVIHGCHHEQDMRQMGGLSKLMPITFGTYLVSTLAIAGIYPFSGYQSKHAILGALAHTENPYILEYVGLFSLVATTTALLTAFYMTRSVVLTFFGSYRGHAHPHESPSPMTIPLIVLAVLATVGGVVLDGRLSHYLDHVLPVHAHHSETIIQSILGSWVGVVGVGLACVSYLVVPALPGVLARALAPVHRLLSDKYYIDELYGLMIVKPLEGLSRILFRVVDQVMIDGAVNGTASVVDITGEVTRGAQTGQIRHYALMMFGSAILLIVFYLVL
jgi:NADH-quinone oxidoreductase subunit L